jgi:hypothetical protein
MTTYPREFTTGLRISLTKMAGMSVRALNAIQYSQATNGGTYAKFAAIETKRRGIL